MQTNYDLYKADSFKGMKGTSEVSNTISKASEGTIPFGVGVVFGSKKERVTLPVATSDLIVGVSVAEHNATGDFQDTDAVSVLRKGTVWMETTVAVQEGEKAYVVSSGVRAGDITNVPTDNFYIGFFRGTADVSALVLVELNLPSN